MLEKYKNLGLTLTPQRLAILDYLEGNREHPSAEKIHRDLAERFPTLSLATVYNTLDTLKQKGMLQDLDIDNTKKRFDPNPRPHHHALCLSCRKVTDLELAFKLPETLVTDDDFEIVESKVAFFGYCGACRRRMGNHLFM
jgi:Fur family peroxide stress response transcriptional regulator